MKKNSLFTAALLLFTIAGMTQPAEKFAGNWEGLLNLGPGLHIVFHIKINANGSLSSTVDSPDQDAYGMTCDTSFVQAQKLTIEMHDLHASFSAQLTNDSTLSGTFVQNSELPLVLTRAKESMQAPVQIGTKEPAYKAIELSIPEKDVTLSGTLFQPLKAGKSVVLIIAGSGPTDRDGNNPILPGKNNSLLQLADSLANYGIASLRYDKRGIGKSKVSAGLNEEALTIDSMINDAHAMYDWLKTQGYTSIFIAGHSEGSLIGMKLAQWVNPAGYISMEGAGRKAGDVLKEQVSDQMPASLKNDFVTAVDSLENGFSVKKINPALMNLLRPSIQPYIRSWLRLDPQKIIAQLTCPILILQGSKDIQVTEIDAQDLYKSNSKAKLVQVDNMNHVLKKVFSDSREDNIKAYSDPSLPIANELLQAIVNFVKGLK